MLMPMFMPAVNDTITDFSFGDSFASAADTTTYNFGVQPIGAATAIRQVFVPFRGAGTRDSGDACTVGGYTLANKIIGSSTALFWGYVPAAAGTSATVIVTTTNSNDRGHGAIYHCQKAAAVELIDSADADITGSGSASVDVSEGGFVIGYISGNASVNVDIASNLTENFDESIGENSQNHSGASDSGLAATVGKTIGYSTSSANGARYIIGSFR